MENFNTLIIYGLACWRFTHTITEDRIFGWLRGWLGKEYVPKRTICKPFKYIRMFFDKMVSCGFCASFWIALFLLSVTGKLTIVNLGAVWALGTIGVHVKDALDRRTSNILEQYEKLD